MNSAPVILLVLVGLVVLFGVGVVVFNRRKSSPQELREAPIAVVVAEPEPEQATGVVRRFARAAGVFNGSFAVLRGKDKITSETWEELEETLLRADVGLSTTTALLESLKSRVGRKDISNPHELLDALQGEMAGQLSSNSRELHFKKTVTVFIDVDNAIK
jgi:fused signal recognition particle receptor